MPRLKKIEGAPVRVDPRPMAEIEADLLERVGDPENVHRNPLGWAPLGRDPSDGCAILATKVLKGPTIDGVEYVKRGYIKITQTGAVHSESMKPKDEIDG